MSAVCACGLRRDTGLRLRKWVRACHVTNVPYTEDTVQWLLALVADPQPSYATRVSEFLLDASHPLGHRCGALVRLLPLARNTLDVFAFGVETLTTAALHAYPPLTVIGTAVVNAVVRGTLFDVVPRDLLVRAARATCRIEDMRWYCASGWIRLQPHLLEKVSHGTSLDTPPVRVAAHLLGVVDVTCPHDVTTRLVDIYKAVDARDTDDLIVRVAGALVRAEVQNVASLLCLCYLRFEPEELLGVRGYVLCTLRASMQCVIDLVYA